MSNIFIINNECKVEEVNYKELVWQFVDITTTPRGVAPRLHIREAIWFEVDGRIFENKSNAEDVSSDNEKDTGVRLEIEEVIRFEGWTWGHQGNFPKQIHVFNTQDEADEWLFEAAEFDFKNDSNAPLTFNTLAEAEKWVKENTSDC